MTTIYYEAGIPASLIPCQFIGWRKTPAHEVTGMWNAVIKLKRTHGAYKTGEVLNVPPHRVVEKAGRRDFFIRVRNAQLPARTEANTLLCGTYPDY